MPLHPGKPYHALFPLQPNRATLTRQPVAKAMLADALLLPWRISRSNLMSRLKIDDFWETSVFQSKLHFIHPTYAIACCESAISQNGVTSFIFLGHIETSLGARSCACEGRQGRVQVCRHQLIILMLTGELFLEKCHRLISSCSRMPLVVLPLLLFRRKLIPFRFHMLFEVNCSLKDTIR